MYANHPSPIDSAWRSRIPAAWREFRPSPIDSAWRSRVPAPTAAPTIEAERAAALAAMAAKASAQTREAIARPFRFEDLNGEPEPLRWGPVYPKTASQAVEKWRTTARGRELSPDESAAYGAAVGDWIRTLNAIKPAPRVSLKYVMPDYAAKARARFAADAAADKRAWAFGKSKNDRGETIAQAYERAMAEKAARLAGETVREPERRNPQPTFKPAKPRARPRKLKAAA